MTEWALRNTQVSPKKNKGGLTHPVGDKHIWILLYSSSDKLNGKKRPNRSHGKTFITINTLNTLGSLTMQWLGALTSHAAENSYRTFASPQI